MQQLEAVHYGGWLVSSELSHAHDEDDGSTLIQLSFLVEKEEKRIYRALSSSLDSISFALTLRVCLAISLDEKDVCYVD